MAHYSSEGDYKPKSTQCGSEGQFTNVYDAGVVFAGIISITFFWFGLLIGWFGHA
jgi:hypothetical protein